MKPWDSWTFEISVSVDGYVAGPDADEEQPLGRGGERLHDGVTSRSGAGGATTRRSAIRSSCSPTTSATGGADVAQQYLAAGHVDEMVLHLAPVLFGGGVPLFAGLVDRIPKLELLETVPAPGVTHTRCRVLN